LFAKLKFPKDYEEEYVWNNFPLFVQVTNDQIDSLGHINNQVRPWLDLIDRLRAVGIEKDLPIPQIAVMGDQSSGKSSVLEALSGVHFPRGAGLVTKCATELRMKNKKDTPWSAQVSLTWGYPQPSEAGKVENPDEIGPKIAKLTEILLQARGKQATFESEHSILIELVSPDVPDLTIIDLPGIVRTTLEGQSKTVVADVDSLLQRYLEQKRTIILAVIPSNVDIATVDIIERASNADPNGDRTVGVLTKPDMIGEGAEQEKVETLLNINKPLKLGYIMVKNRSQKQIDEGVTLDEAKQIERSWFSGHQHFKSLDPSLFGADNLAGKLTDILVDRIKDSIPQLHKEITQLLDRTSQDLEALGACPPSTVDNMRAALMSFLMLVANDVGSAIGGNYDSSVLQDNPKTRIFARFRMFAYDFNQAVLKDKPQWTVEEVKTAIREMRGRELPGFPKFSVFEHLVRGYVGRWRLAAQRLLSDAKEMAAEACDEIIEHHVPQFRRLSGALRALLQANRLHYYYLNTILLSYFIF
jgi:interferon-induced GTP-binding protein Mx